MARLRPPLTRSPLPLPSIIHLVSSLFIAPLCFSSISNMSLSSSSSTFQALFETALQDYKDKTGNTLIDHPIAKQFETCKSVNSISAILQEQARSFREFRENDGRLVKALNSLVDLLCAPSISSTLNQAIGIVVCRGAFISVPCSRYFLQPFPPVTVILVGFGILLAVCLSFFDLICIFTRHLISLDGQRNAR